MKFASPGIATEYEHAHPRTKSLIEAVDTFCIAREIPEVVVTDVERPEDFYEENNLAPMKFSWHYACPGETRGSKVVCAVDIRIKHWTETQQGAVRAFIQGIAAGPEWELIFRLHGTGPHFHLAYRDFGARRRREIQSMPNHPEAKA